MSFKTQLFINGQYVDSAKGETFTVYKPTTGTVLCEVSNATAEDIDIAVAAAKAALYSPDWGYNSTFEQRATILRNLANIIDSKKDELARLDSLDQGKPLREANADMGDCITACNHFADLAEDMGRKEGSLVDNGTEDFTSRIYHEPIGVIAMITPWNYPLLMAVWKIVAGIASGSAMVLKPSELAPLSCILLGQMCADAGLPAGALNVVPGLGASAGGPLSSHGDVDKVSFTGSLPTAQKIMAAAALGPRGLSLELGGKSPLIVFEDADIAGAVDWICTGILWGSGQVCSATSRVLIHSSIRERVLSAVVDKMKTLRVGDTSTEENIAFEGPLMGPVVSKGQYDKIWKIIDDAKAEGCAVAYGGDRSLVSALGEGYYIPPTVFVDPPMDSFVWREEIFGPVLCVRSFDSEEEAIRVANDSQYGLAAAVFSADKARLERCMKGLRAGIVWGNCCQPAFVQTPWGGVKKSGFGRELGKWGLEEFSSVKVVHTCAPEFKWDLW